MRRPEQERRVRGHDLAGTISLRKKYNNVYCPYNVKVQYLIKKGHIAINYKNGCQFILNMPGERKYN
jgi:hypothetical protein